MGEDTKDRLEGHIAADTSGHLSILRYFRYAHLPDKLALTSERFALLACILIETLPGNPERTVALRKLLEAKDCAVRALVG